MKPAVVCILCLLAVPVHAQKSEERLNKERAAMLAFWTGIAAATTGATASFASPKIGVPFVAAGGALIFYGIHLNNQAKQMPFTRFAVMPVRRGLAVGVRRVW